MMAITIAMVILGFITSRMVQRAINWLTKGEPNEVIDALVWLLRRIKKFVWDLAAASLIVAVAMVLFYYYSN